MTAAAYRPVTKADFASPITAAVRPGTCNVSLRVPARSGPWSRKIRAPSEPRSAMPRVLPISLQVSAIAAADPARSAGTVATAVSATTLNEMP
jgi:hypothetical protein